MAGRFFAVEGIHQLRVEIKKLRALYRTIEELSDDYDSREHRHAFRKLFRAAGLLRDVDIQQALVAEALRNSEVSEFFNHLKTKEMAGRPALAHLYADFTPARLNSVKRRVVQAIAGTPPDLLRERLWDWIGSRGKQLMELTRVQTTDQERLHEIRKRSKALRYVLDLTEVLYGPTAATKRSIRCLKNSYGPLGDWRDAELTRQTLQSSLADDQSGRPAAPQAYRAFSDQLKSRSKQRLTIYRRAVPSLHDALQRLTTTQGPARGRHTKTDKQAREVPA